ncbi:MAG TPA: hemerythrin domain-containing protein [Myxococcota bacterium]|nr:hemerythrin domain-containing protein [Myxococcota bacterium]
MADALETGLRLRLRRALRRVESQHTRMRELLRDLEDAVRQGDPAAAIAPLGRLRDALAAHFDLEDQVLFPALHGLSPSARLALEALSDQHRSFLGELLDMRAGKCACDAAAVSRLHAAIGDHERREEFLLEEVVDKAGLQETA